MQYRTYLKYWLKGQRAAFHFQRNKNRPPSLSGKRILVYHGIDQKNNTYYNTKFISLKRFEKEMRLLKAHFQVLPLNELIELPSHPDRLQVAITFDDGYANNYELARPLLEQLQIPATFFISTPQQKGYDILWADLLDLAWRNGPDQLPIKENLFIKGKKGYFQQNELNLKTCCRQNDGAYIEEVIRGLEPFAHFKKNSSQDLYWKLMSPDQIRNLAKNPLFSVGAHGVLHSSVHHQKEKEARRELADSKAYLENLIQSEVDSFAYPFGSANPSSITWGRESHYHQLFLADSRQDALALSKDVHNRIGINPFISAEAQMYYFLKGSY